MNRKVYQERRTYQRYDEAHIIGYLNEEELENYIPSGNINSDGNEEPEPWPRAYAYTGSETDGGTVMECSCQDNYGEIANAIIRTQYTESQELAIQRHAINGDYEEAPQEFEQYNAWCQYAVQTAKAWIAARN
jgi:hypothetical protein